jgi:phage gpG-like protein
VEYHADPDWHSHVETAAQDWFRRIVGEVESDAKALAPVDTGALRASISSEISGDTARIGSNLDYSLYVEEGHRVAYRGADGTTHYTGEVVPPEPFLKPALYRKR